MTKSIPYNNPFDGQKRKRCFIECTLLVVITIVLRLLFVGKTDLGFDEGFSLFVSLKKQTDIVNLLCTGDNPPLWEIMLHFWVGIFGISEIAIRCLSLIFNALTIIPIYLIGEKHIGRHAGAAASLFFAFSSFSIFLSHDSRVYSLIGFFAAWSAYLFINCIHNQKKSNFIWLTFVNILLMYGHYLSIWMIVMEFAVFIFNGNIRKKIRKGYWIHILALAALFSPMIPTLLRRFLDSGVNGTWIPKASGIEDVYSFICCMSNAPVTAVIAIIILAVAFAFFIYMVINKKANFSNTTIISLFWIVPMSVSFALSFITGFFLDRYFYFLFPFFYLSIAAYAFQIFPLRKPFQIGIMSVFAIAMALSFSPDSSKKRYSGWHDEIQPIVSQLVETKQNERTIVIIPEYFDKQFTYYLDDKHLAFKEKGQNGLYYAFYDYLCGLGYYYDCNFQDADFEQNDKAVFACRKSMPLNQINNYLINSGFHLQEEKEECQFIIYTYSKSLNSAEQKNSTKNVSAQKTFSTTL